MDIIVDQNDVVYRYRCNEQCDACSIRYICYTNKNVNGVVHLRGQSYSDLLMLRTRLDSLITSQEVLCSLCYRHEHKIVARPLGEKCPECGHYITCEKCEASNCSFRGDGYNTSGDCIMEK